MPLLWGKRDSMNTPHDAVHTLTPLATVRLVAGREIAERLRSRLIWIVTALTTLLVVALIVIPALVRQPAKQPAKPTVVGLMGPSAQALAPALQATAGAAKMAIRTVDVQTSAAARSELKKGSLDVALSVDAHAAVAEVRGSVGSFQVQTLSPTLRAVLQATVDAAHQRRVLAEAGVPLATMRAAMAPVPFSTRTLHPPPTDLALATAGALVGRQEEVQFVTLPFVMPLVGGFLLTYAAIAAPDAWWIRLLGGGSRGNSRRRA